MGMLEAVSSVFSKYVTFSGRARRAEYWWFTLFSTIMGIVMQIADGVVFGTKPMTEPMAMPSIGIIYGIWTLVILLPSVAVWVRRLHDIGRSGWWWLLLFIPIIGWIVLLYWAVKRGDIGPNAFGDDPIGMAM